MTRRREETAVSPPLLATQARNSLAGNKRNLPTRPHNPPAASGAGTRDDYWTANNGTFLAQYGHVDSSQSRSG